MDINLIRLTFAGLSLSTGILGLSLNYLERCLPVIITRTYRYGKYAATENCSIVSKAEVPKRWYQHFYIFAAPLASVTLYLATCRYILNGQVPELVHQVLDVSLGVSRQALVSPENALIAIALLTIQCWKRVYETHCVNIFSNAMMNICHYLCGFIHYAGAVLCTIGESEGFVRGRTNGHEATFSWRNVTLLQLICIIIFLWSSYAQLKASVVLRQLRQDKNDKIVRSGYKIPYGALFEYVSGALQFTEILMYIVLSTLLWKSSTFHYVTAWVLVNQVECAVLTHQWYKQTFKNYPKSRKAIIPFVF